MLEYEEKATSREEVNILAMSQCGASLGNIPWNERTPAVCMAAVVNFGLAMNHVPEEVKTPEFCLEAARRNGAVLLGDFPEAEKTREVCLAAVRSYGLALKYVPKENKDSEICLAAVKRDGQALEYVPWGLRTPELCLAAVQDKRWTFKFVPEGIRNEVRDMLAAAREARAQYIASTDPVEAACADFAASAREFALPPGCSLQLETKPLDDGRFAVRISVSDPQEKCWSAGSAPSAVAVYKSGHDQVKCLRAFADKLEGKSGKPVETMPAGMKSFCAGAVRKAADVAEACIAAAAEREEESAGPRP